MEKKEQIRNLINRLETVRAFILQKEEDFLPLIRDVDDSHTDSARNLIRYLALRTFNLRDLQAQLSYLGLSSIGTSERYTLANVDNILHLLYLIIGETYYGEKVLHHHHTDFYSSWEKLQAKSDKLFGSTEKRKDQEKTPHIMVTMPSEAAANYSLIEELVASGMNIARINCGHDNPDVWEAMIKHIHKASDTLKKDCRIYMDLAGPKIRTGVVEIRKKKKKSKKQIDYISLKAGDLLHLHRNKITGRDAVYDHSEKQLYPAQISCTLPQVFDFIKLNQSVWFDDGKIGSRIEKIEADYAALRITHTGIKGAKLKAQKGINLPDTQLELPSLTDDDLEALPFAAKHADIIGYSFIRQPVDVDILRRHLIKLGRKDIGLVLKIENKSAFANLPALLLTAMKHKSIGVMIARGDLAVEVGWERIAEVQEQILWICEAAHVPIIWATQVLESLAKKGTASRAEITDAAMSNRAECVMLNKGPFIIEAVKVLQDILKRMQAHQFKKKETLRSLKVANDFFTA
ncbi:MAG: pyruvate kinase [Bacteroidetes bacterium]|nr:pyruvate kinase [Bacteroidota bacterium]